MSTSSSLAFFMKGSPARIVQASAMPRAALQEAMKDINFPVRIDDRTDWVAQGLNHTRGPVAV